MNSNNFVILLTKDISWKQLSTMELSPTDDDVQDQNGNLYKMQYRCFTFIKKHSKIWKIFIGITVTLAIGAYISYALYYSIEDNIAIIVFSGLAVLFGAGYLLKTVFTRTFEKLRFSESQKKYKRYVTR